jgi:hypothetical protein
VFSEIPIYGPSARESRFLAYLQSSPRQGLFFRLVLAQNSPHFYLQSRTYITIAAFADKKGSRSRYLYRRVGLQEGDLQSALAQILPPSKARFHYPKA